MAEDIINENGGKDLKFENFKDLVNRSEMLVLMTMKF